ncbi:MAG: hypothetical protein ABI723_25350 [Bacteroidia bacterium]
MKILPLSLFFLFLFISADAERKVIHVFVALCDNKNQGIVPVPAKIGNGQDLVNNLYWGCAYGVKSYFKKQSDWQLVKSIINPQKFILERIIFKNKNSDVYLVADAYDGANIKECTVDFLEATSGGNKLTITVNDFQLAIGGNANLICYVGHDGLMDFDLEKYAVKKDDTKREAIILACVSKSYFKEAIKQSGAYPVLWTSNLMCPEAYTLKAAIDGWIKNENYETIRNRAASEYSKYQKCSIGAAKGLLVTGW